MDGVLAPPLFKGLPVQSAPNFVCPHRSLSLLCSSLIFFVAQSQSVGVSALNHTTDATAATHTHTRRTSARHTPSYPSSQLAMIPDQHCGK